MQVTVQQREYDRTHPDDGAGPYTHCEEGRSRCGDMNCGCVDNYMYRRAYRMARREKGWDIYPGDMQHSNPRALTAWWLLSLAAAALVGAGAAYLIMEGWR